VTNNIKHLWPNPPTTPAEALQHTLDAYHDSPDDKLAIIATAGQYGFRPNSDRPIMTGLTWGDLRQIAGKLRSECRCIKDRSFGSADVTLILPPDGCPKHEGDKA
jgi:hypothetical protein